MPEEMQGEHDVVDTPRVALHDKLSLQGRCTRMAFQVSTDGHRLRGLVQQRVQVANLVKRQPQFRQVRQVQ